MRRIILGLLMMASFVLHAQEKYFKEPLKIPIQLTGTFAELRVNHFHSGIDIRTEGRTGLPVYPAAVGYISRIVVSPTGFGHALYIDHPNGMTTLYGHLERFAEPVDSFVKDLQYQKKSFSIDVTIPPGQFLVSPKQIIAYSGDTGNSGGPHLHFEIRDTQTQEPLNPLDFNLNIKDNIRPDIKSLKIFPLNNRSQVDYSRKPDSYEVILYDGKYHLKNNPVIPVYGNIGFGVQVNDYLNGTWNKCGINYLQLKIDGEEYFSFKLDSFSYADTRYINSLIDYAGFIKNNRRYYKTWKDPGNQLNIYKINKNNGSFDATDNRDHEVEITVKDSYGNSSQLTFTIKSAFKELPPEEDKGVKIFYYNRANYFKAGGITLSCPKGAFYTDFNFNYDVDYGKENPTLYSVIHIVSDPSIPIQQPLKLSIKPDGLPERLADKALLVTVNKKTGKESAAGGNYNDGYVTANITSFGNFAVAVDTVPPDITPLSIRNWKELVDKNRIRFIIKDNLSGIKSFTGTIDGKWVLFEYNPKRSLLFYVFDDKRLEMNKTHTLRLEVTDSENNPATYEASFFR